VHVLESEDDLGAVEADLGLREDSVLWEVIVKVTTIHQVQDETQLLRRLKCVRHAHNKRTAFLLANDSKYTLKRTI